MASQASQPNRWNQVFLILGRLGRLFSTLARMREECSTNSNVSVYMCKDWESAVPSVPSWLRRMALDLPATAPHECGLILGRLGRLFPTLARMEKGIHACMCKD